MQPEPPAGASDAEIGITQSLSHARRRVAATTRLVLMEAPRGALITTLVLLIIITFGPMASAHDPTSGRLTDALIPPAWYEGGRWEFPFGTDQLGRDVLSRLLHGGRTTMLVASAGVLFSGLIGSVLGLIAGYTGGLVDELLMRVTDAALSIPVLILGLAIATALGPGVGNVVIAITAVAWAYFARLVRGEALHLRESDYIVAVRLMGVPRWKIVFGHLMPNVVGPILVMATLQVGNTVVIAASLSFLGLGIPEPMSEWGLMLANAKAFLATSPWLTIVPGTALAATVLSANLMGDWVRDVFDPRMSTGRAGPRL